MNAPANPQAKRHLGQILIDQGILTEDQLRIALLEQTKQHVPVGRLLVQLGFVSEATLRDALSEKRRRLRGTARRPGRSWAPSSCRPRNAPNDRSARR